MADFNASDVFRQAEWYDRTIDWRARLMREIPVLTDVLGPPGEGGLLDAGCGTGRQACALAQRGYRVVGADSSPDMLAVARRNAEAASAGATFVLTPYSALHETIGGGFDGLYCLANALAAAGSREAVKEAVGQFAGCLRPGGRVFIQILNFSMMRAESSCIRGPRVVAVGGKEYVSVRHFVFIDDVVTVTNITLWRDEGWKTHTHGGTLYPVTLGELRSWCEAASLRFDDVWGAYDRSAFDPEHSVDLILTATRV